MSPKKKVEQDNTDELKAIKPENASEIAIHRFYDGRSRLRVQFDIQYKGNPGKTPSGESQTEPDMTLSVGQLLERHSRGKDVPMKQPIYFETEIPTFSDLTDVERYREQLKDRLKETEKFIKDEQTAAAEQPQPQPTTKGEEKTAAKDKKEKVTESSDNA